MLYITKFFQWITTLFTSDVSINNHHNDKKHHINRMLNVFSSHNSLQNIENTYESKEYTYKKKKKN